MDPVRAGGKSHRRTHRTRGRNRSAGRIAARLKLGSVPTRTPTQSEAQRKVACGFTRLDATRDENLQATVVGDGGRGKTLSFSMKNAVLHLSGVQSGVPASTLALDPRWIELLARVLDEQVGQGGGSCIEGSAADG